MKRWITTLLALALPGMAVTGAAGAADRGLAELIRDGERPAALALIDAGTDVNAAQPDGTTPLHWAAYRVDAELTRKLLAHGARPGVANALGSTPLAEAARVGDAAIVRLLLKAGADPQAGNADGQTPLLLAARTGVVDVARELLAKGARVDARETWRGQTALMWAAAEGHAEMTRFLIARGAAVNVRANVNQWATQVTNEPRAQYRPTGGLTPLLFATRAGCQGCVEALLKAKADIDLPTPDGTTPLMIAIDNSHFGLARYLLERGANPHYADWWGRTALYVAVDMNSYGTRGAEAAGEVTALDVMRLLLERGVDPNPQLLLHRPGRGGNSGRFTDDALTVGATPLLRAAVSFDVPAVKLLLEHGALPELGNVMGVTPAMVASGLSVSTRDTRGDYGSDAQQRAVATLELLVAAGADLNARVTDTSSRTGRIARPSSMTNREGQTALYGAINWGWADVVKFLLDHGARVDVTDAAGKSPRDAVAGNAGGRDHRAVEEVAKLIR
jgi:ankyrin repeat protein